MTRQVVVDVEPCPLAAQPSTRSCNGWGSRCAGCFGDGSRAVLDTAIEVEPGTAVLAKYVVARAYSNGPGPGVKMTRAVWVPREDGDQ